MTRDYLRIARFCALGGMWVALASTWIVSAAKCEAQNAPREPATEPSPEHFKPVWTLGLKWEIETVSRQSAARRDIRRGEMGKPVRWLFEVVKLQRIDDVECYEVRVTCRDVQQAPQTTLWVDRNSMTLRRVAAQLPAPDGTRLITESYTSDSGQPFPAFAPLTVPPLELPLFLAGAKGAQTFNYRASTQPAGAKPVGDVDFRFAIEQSTQRTSAAEIKALLPEDLTKSLAVQPTLDVRLTAARQQVRQLWQAGSPWPLYSDNSVVTARLIQVTQPQPTP